ncbi:pyridoxal phosphate-dependent aminotransferase [Paenibacillaceae bacterium]|nr:pyridoxal phosphate-dependent aminotransferase [Paenibacillaceae bacterium]
MTFNFDQHINRLGTNSYKWDQSQKLFGDSDILPLWVADMDFESPPAVQESLRKRTEQGIYGYTIKTDDYIDAIRSWFKRRHNWEIESKWISDSPGIVTSLSLAVELFSKPGDAVILQSPVYYPFYDVIRMNGREVAANPLLLNNGRYEMDFEQLEQLMKDGARLLLFCSPHNPGGRVWEREELEQLSALCVKYDVIVVSDEIHCDLVLADKRHIPLASISAEIADRTLTCLAPTKTFNIPGLQSSVIVTPNAKLKQTIDYRIKTLSLHMTHFFTPEAVAAAYNEGDAWLDELLVYLRGNADYAVDFLSRELPEITTMRPEATYLLWLDCRGLGLSISELKKLMFEQAKVAFSEGSVFGVEGEGHLRINLACPRSLLQEALERFVAAARAR